MQDNIKINEKASALVVAMLVIFVATVFIGIAVSLTTNTGRQTDASRDFATLKSSAEGALDFAYGIWSKTINSYYRPVTKVQLNGPMATVPTFTGYSYAPSAENGPLQINAVDEYGQPMASPSATPSATKLNLENYPGWIGYNSTYIASVRLMGTSTGGRTIKYGVKRAMSYAVVPLFQATAFFEDDLELYKTAKMTIGGLVHTNNKAYVSSPTAGILTFTGNLSYVNGYTDSVEPPKADTWSGYTPNSTLPPTFPTGFDDQVAQVSRMEPLGTDSSTLLDTTDSNPNNDSMRELIEPPKSAFPDPTPIAERRLYNKAGIVIHVTSTTSKGKTTITESITTQNGTALTNKQITDIEKALSQETIYDRREGKYLDLTSLDMSKAKSVFNAASGFNNIVYIDQTDSSGNLSTSDPKGIRLTNGDTLPTDGITIASQNPVYIEGDYNTKGQRPSSAVFADAVTILSNGWKDSNSTFLLPLRPAKDTEVNTAIVAGFLPSGWTNPDTKVQYGYSGGLNNFPRFLEDWSNDVFTYNGSMIELFTSQIAIGEWDTGNIYSPPQRVWDFDAKFASTPPPGSLDAVVIGRGAIARF